MLLNVGKQGLPKINRAELHLAMHDGRVRQRALSALQHHQLGALHVELQQIDPSLRQDVVEATRHDLFRAHRTPDHSDD